MKTQLDYLGTITQSFKIIWCNKYLWILGFFSAGFGLLSNFSPNFRIKAADFVNLNLNLDKLFLVTTDFLTRNRLTSIAIITGILITITLLVILGCLSQGGIIYSVNQIAQKREKKFGLKNSLTVGKKFFWRILGIDLLFLLFILLILALFGGIPLALLLGQKRVIYALILGVLGLPISFFFGLLALFILRYGAIFIVLENKKLQTAIPAGYQLLLKNIGPTILMNILLWIINLLLSSLYLLAFVILSIPLAIIAIILFLVLPSGALSPLLILFFFLGFLSGIVITGMISAFESTAWTLSFRQFNQGK